MTIPTPAAFPTLPVLPQPVTWGVGSLIKTPQLRADVSDCVSLMMGPPIFSGYQDASAIQSITSATLTEVNITTELADTWAGHYVNTNKPRYYAQLAGVYLMRASIPFSSQIQPTTVGCSAGVRRITGGGATVTFMGERMPWINTVNAVPMCSKLVSQTNTGPIGGTGDWMAPMAYQDIGAGVNLAASAGRFPSFYLQWVGATSGTEPLIVPNNNTWAVPPAPVTSAFMNANVRDTINFLIFPPYMEWQYNAAVASLASSTTIPASGPVIGLDTQNFDNYSAFNNGTNVWTAPVGGIYYVYGQLALSSGANSVSIMAGININSNFYNGGSAFTWWGGTHSTLTANISCAATERRLRLNAGDTISLSGWQHNSAASSHTIQGNSTSWTTRLIIVWQAA